ncbi:uncharacterized protein V6R79_022034 [Siganus canaliculatus]
MLARFDPPVDSHRAASGQSQDISNVLASIFKDIYTKENGKDTLTNLSKTKDGRSSHHVRYEELQQAHSEYSQRIKEADMLQDHIIQAGALAAATESLAYQTMRESGHFYEGQGVHSVKSAFSSCVDAGLLEIHNLISPKDYLTTQKIPMKAPSPIKPNPARPTIAYSMHISKELQDDGTVNPSPKKKVPEVNESVLGLSFDSSTDTQTRKKTPKEKCKPRPKWKDEPSMNDRAEGLSELQKLKERHAFLCNPRFLPPNVQQGGISLIQSQTKARKGTLEKSSSDDPAPVFLAKPPVVVFSDYSVGHVYETTLELKNLTSASRHVRVIPPTTPYFSIGLGRFPGEGGVVAPGMSCKFSVRFAPDSLGNYDNFILVESQAEHLLMVPIAAKRPPPVLTLPSELDCGHCLIGGVKFIGFLCQNVGLSTGTFCIIPKNQWLASNLRPVARSYFCEQPPFAVSPSLFELQPGEATVVEVAFFPTTPEKVCQVFTVVCDNCQVKDISIEGEGQLIALELVSVSGEREPPVVGEVHDLTAEHFVRFSPWNPHSVQQKKIVIRNNVHLELAFNWQIMKPNLRPLFPGEIPEPSHIHFHLASDGVFDVSPQMGVLAPCQETEFLFTFCPKELKDYHSVCHLVIRDVPHLPPESCDNGALQPVCISSKVSDVIVMEIEVKGSAEPYQVLLEPYAVVIPGEVYILTKTRKQFKMWNHSKTCVFFQWELINSSTCMIEVEPSAGKIEENECFDFDLLVTGEKPGKVQTSVFCHIKDHHEPVPLAVEASFKGPIVSLSAPSVDFGLVKLGDETQTTLLLTNITQLEASWTLKGRQHYLDTQVSVNPCRGVLGPFASCSVDVLFLPHFCQKYETELELTVENGTGCHLQVRAEVQSPQMCLLSSKLLLSDLYVGVLAKASVTLYNQTLLPSQFSWMAQLQGKHAELCAASFDPPSGTLGPNTSMEITVHFISHTDLELTEVAALCEVQGMSSPLVLSIVTSKTKKLSVSYSLPRVCSNQDDKSSSTLLLDFGDDVILTRAVTKQLLITNETAITAPFTIEAEYFACQASEPNSHSKKRITYVKKPLHSVHAKKLEEKAHEEFVDGLLAHGKGAAFFVLPNSGVLGPFEALVVDVTAYTEMWGEYRDRLICKVGDLEAAFIPMQMTVKGCPLYFRMTGPRPDGQNLEPIIKFGTHVSGGDTVSRSLRINNPTKFDIVIDWETYNVSPNDRKRLDGALTYGEASPAEDSGGSDGFSGTLRISDGDVEPAQEGNASRDSMGTSASLQSTDEKEEEQHMSEEGHKEEDICIFPIPERKKPSSVLTDHPAGNLSDYPFCITPQQTVIPAKGSSTIHASFTPLTLSGSVSESRCVGLALGFLSLDSEMAACVPGKVERAQGSDLEPVRLDLQAAVKTPVLLVQMEEDEGVLEFHASASDLLRGETQKELAVHEFDITQSLCLINNSDMLLHFGLRAEPPFSVVKPRPLVRTSTPSSLPSADSPSLTLQQQHSMQVKVAFHCSLSLLDHADQVNDEVPSGVRLIQTASGHRKLRFEQNLLIHYSNNTLQTVPLCAHLDLPSMCLSTDSIDFGFCHVGQTQTVEVSLCSRGGHTHWKSHIESFAEDSSIFGVTPDFGVLRSKQAHLSSCSQCLQISFTPSEARAFTARVMICSPLVKTSLTLQLQGTGSFRST